MMKPRSRKARSRKSPLVASNSELTDLRGKSLTARIAMIHFKI